LWEDCYFHDAASTLESILHFSHPPSPNPYLLFENVAFAPHIHFIKKKKLKQARACCPYKALLIRGGIGALDGI